MKKPRDSQRNMYPHSAVKVELLRKYIQIYLNVLNNSNYVDDVYLFDLFCGPGIHKNDGIGSPLIMLEEINKICSFSDKKKYHCLFNDVDVEAIDQLQCSIGDKGLASSGLDIEYMSIDYRKVIELVVKKTAGMSAGQKAFVFIDPYGYGDIRVNDIFSLLSTKKTEVLLFLSTQFMFRFHKKATPESLKKFIEELVPMSEWPESSTGIEFIENLKESFKLRFDSGYYVDSFIIKRDAGQYFCLFFFTSHLYGFEKMLEAKWNIDKQEGRGWQYEHTYNLFDAQKSSNTIMFEGQLKEFLICPRTNKEVYEFTLNNNHLPRHSVDVLTELQESGQLEIKTKDGGSVRKKSFYLDYQITKKEPDKVIMKLLDK
jgi:three-Cys-motif partner protein